MPLKYFEEIENTNDFIRNNLQNFQTDFSGVYTFNQTKGRGQGGAKWSSEPGKNIALTFCLVNKIKKDVNVSFWIAVCLRNFLQKISGLSSQIKWPNDILVQKKKLSGILVEKVNGVYIIGIGINVMQENFEGLPRASSLYLLTHREKEYSLDILVEDLILYLQKEYQLLSEEKLLRELYNQYLFGRNKVMTFYVNKEKKNGIVRKVGENGLLHVEFEDENKIFRNKEIEFLY